MEIHVKQYVQIKYKLYQYNIGSPDTKCRLNLTCTNKKTSADLKNVNRFRNTQVFTSLKSSHGKLKCSVSLILSKYMILMTFKLVTKCQKLLTNFVSNIRLLHRCSKLFHPAWRTEKE